MTASQFLHGVEVIEVPGATQPVTINKMGVAAFIGTAPSADADEFPMDEPVLLTSSPRKAALLGTTGTLAAAVNDYYNEGGGACFVVRVDMTGATTQDQQMTKIIGAQSGKTGAYALLGARAKYGVIPRTLCAPGYTAYRPTVNSAPAANPVVNALLGIATKLRGRVYASTPSTGIAAAQAWREDFGSDRLVPFYPNVLTWDAATSAYVTRPADAVMAGLTSRVQRDLGFWYSPSNQRLQSIGGISAAVDFAPGDPDCEANILNENRIATMINVGQATGINYGGWRRWGNRTTADDDNWVFECVRTTEDAVYEALDEATLWAVDKPPSKQLLLDMTERANRFFKFGVSQGFLVGGRCWLDPEDNTPDQMKNGVFAWRIDPEAPAPMEHIIYYAQRNADYYTQELASLSAMISANVGS